MTLRIAVAVAVLVSAADMYVFRRMTKCIRETDPELHRRYFGAGVWTQFFDDSSNTLWDFYRSPAGNDDPVIGRLKSLSKGMSFAVGVAWFVVVGVIYRS